MANKEKTFNRKLYAFVVFFAVLAALIVLVVFTFKSKYTAFHPENVAQSYVDTIVQTGDGYNAYKYSVVSKNSKYGDFIRENYMYPIIYRDAQGYTKGESVKKLKGYNDESYKGSLTQTDDGKKQGVVIDKMYDYYVELVKNGWDDYDTIFTLYFEKLVEVRKEVFNDDYLTDDIMFTALEANVTTYGQNLAGAEEKRDENTNDILQKEVKGKYQTVYGDGYEILTEVKGEESITLDEYKNKADSEALKTYGVSGDDISDVKCYNVDVKINGEVAKSVKVTVIKIGNSWYVDNILTDTDELYNIV